MNDIPVENVKIVLVYTETWRVKRKINYNLCLGLVNGNVVKSNVPKNNIHYSFLHASPALEYRPVLPVKMLADILPIGMRSSHL